MAESGSEEKRELDGSKVKVKRKKRLSAFDVSEIIQSKKLKSITELQALAQQQKREGKTDLAEFILNRSPRVLADIFNSSYEMLNAEENISRSQKTRMEILEEVLQGDCADSCNVNWLECAKEVLRNNGVDAFNFAAAVVHSLEKGRGKFRNVMIIGPANCAKTFLLNPLNIIYKTFTNPASGRFAWVGVEQAECIFLNDFRWNADLIPWHDLLLLLEGQQVHLPAPKTHFAKDIALVNDTPIFATTKNQLVYVKNGIVDARETEMMSVRWNIITFYWQISQERQREIPPCARCFARLVTMKAS